MKKILITTLVAALVIGCGKEEKTPAKNKTPAKPAGNLLEAASNGDLQAVRAHIAAGSDLNQKDPNGSMPLLIAATFGHVEVCQVLIAGGADLNLRNNDGNTALISAAFMCHPEIVKTLLAKGADPNIKDKTGLTARDTAGLPWEAVKPIYDLLNGIIFQPMGKPVDYGRIQKTRPEIANILRAHVGKGTPDGKPGADKDLHKAAADGNLKAVQKHIAAKVNLNQKDPTGAAALLWAATFGHVEVCQALIKAGADINIKNNDGTTPLMSAAFLCHPEVVKLLLKNGADKWIKNNQGSTAQESVEAPWAATKPIYDILNGILYLPQGKSLDFDRIQKTRPEIAELLSKAGALGLHDAVFGEDLAEVKKLIAGGANVNALKPDDGSTPLHLAVFMCNIEIVEALIAAKADVNAKNKKGEAPLVAATIPWETIKPGYDFIGPLLQKKFDLERIEKDRVKVAEILRAAGAK